MMEGVLLLISVTITLKTPQPSTSRNLLSDHCISILRNSSVKTPLLSYLRQPHQTLKKFSPARVAQLLSVDL